MTSLGFVNEEILNPAQQTAAQPGETPLLARSSELLSGILDSFSSFFFCLSFSSLTHLLGSWWNRFLAEE
jgi:hypothetical protein